MFPILTYVCLLFFSDGDYYKTSHGEVSFLSRATLEKIKGHSNELRGVINQRTNSFSFAVALDSFYGFNSELQKEHYSENYVESDYFPDAKFTGKIIEEIDFNKPGTYAVRAKGNFDLHGIVINKIIHATLTIINDKQLKIESDFSFSLTEFSIKVPRLVHRKVAENIEIHVGIRMNK